MVDFLFVIGEVVVVCLTLICLLYCSWYYIRQGGVKNTMFGILVLLVVWIIPAGPIIFAAYLYTKKEAENPTVDTGKPTE